MAAAAESKSTGSSPPPAAATPREPSPVGGLNGRDVTPACESDELVIKITVVVGLLLGTIGGLCIAEIFPSRFLGGMPGSICFASCGGILAISNGFALIVFKRQRDEIKRLESQPQE